MIIKRDKDYPFLCGFYIFCVVLLFLLYVYGCGTPFEIALLFNFPVCVLGIPIFISYGRTFIMDENGCTVCFWKYHKKYIWEELHTKRIEKHHLPSLLDGRYSYPYLTEVVFSPHKIRKPRFIRGATYCLLHPLSCIYVNFSPKNQNYSSGRYYEVDEAIFRQKMSEWNVALEEM